KRQDDEEHAGVVDQRVKVVVKKPTARREGIRLAEHPADSPRSSLKRLRQKRLIAHERGDVKIVVPLPDEGKEEGDDQPGDASGEHDSEKCAEKPRAVDKRRLFELSRHP